MKTKKTIVALRLKSRTAFELAVLLKMLFVAGMIFGMMFGCQVYLCKQESKDTPWMDCLKPHAKSRR